MSTKPASPLAASRSNPLQERHVSASALALAISGSLIAGLAHAASPTSVTLDTVKVEGEIQADENPNAEPGAPYKVNDIASPKYSRPVAETPKSITVLSKESIEDSGSTDLADVLRAQPGVTISTGEGGNAFGDRFIIRGFEARNDVFSDGLRDPGVTSRETFAVEQVEVAKGPSSSFAGRGTTGGAVNSVTKKPTDDDFTRVQAGIGTDSKYRLTLDNNTVISDDLAVRSNLLVADRDVPDREGATESRQGAAVAVEWQATDALKVNADYYYQKGEDVPDGGVPWDSVKGEPVSGSHFYGQKGRDFWDTSSNIATLSLEYELSDDITLVNQTRYGRTSNEYVVTIPGLRAVDENGDAVQGDIGADTDGVFVSASSQNRNQDTRYIGNQTNLLWDMELGGKEHNVVLGFEVSREEAKNLPYTDSVRSPNAGDPDNPNNNAWIEEGGTLTANPDRYAELEVDTWSIYLLDTVRLNQSWELFGGLRVDHFDYGVVSGATAYEGSTDGKLRNQDTFLNMHFGVVFSPWENGNVYATYATSSNPSGEQLDAFTNCAYGGICQDGENGVPSPERNRSVEVGSKWELFDRKLLLTAAMFNIVKDDVISSSGGRGAPVTITQVGQLRVRGIELGLVGNITDKLSIQSGIAILDTEITESDNPDEVGESFPNTAEESANVQLKYQPTSSWAVGGTVTYTGEISGGTPNGPTTGNTLDSNVRLDLMTEYKLSEALAVRLNILNATDTEYYDALYRSGSPFTYVGEGRSATVSLDYTF